MYKTIQAEYRAHKSRSQIELLFRGSNTLQCTEPRDKDIVDSGLWHVVRDQIGRFRFMTHCMRSKTKRVPALHRATCTRDLDWKIGSDSQFGWDSGSCRL